jgi:hypothetical protein
MAVGSVVRFREIYVLLAGYHSTKCVHDASQSRICFVRASRSMVVTVALYTMFLVNARTFLRLVPRVV